MHMERARGFEGPLRHTSPSASVIASEEGTSALPPADNVGDKVRIIGLSIDKSAEAVVKHVDDKKWNSVEHYWRAKSKCSDTYSVRGVPCVMLIDQNGKIVFKGHPASRPDLEKDLNDLAEGKELSAKDDAEAAEEGAEATTGAVDAATMLPPA